MSAASANEPGRLKQNYEKILLILILVGLVASTLYLFIRIGHVRSALAAKDGVVDSAEKQPLEPADTAFWEQKLGKVDEPFQSSRFTNQMMTSELRVDCIQSDCTNAIPYHAAICGVCGSTQPTIVSEAKLDRDGDGIPDKFELEHGLKPFDPADATEDKDGDSFTNIEEYNAEAGRWETDPSDPKDFPPVVVKLRVAGVVDRPFKLRFQGVNELPDGKIFLLNLRTLDQSYFARLGESVEGYEVMRFDEKILTNSAGKKVDRSTLTLRKGDELIELVKNKARMRHERSAKLILLVDKSRHLKRIGDELDLMGHRYNVIDIRGDGVLIRDMQTGKDTLVPRLSDSEKRRLTRGSEESSLHPGTSVPGGPRRPAGDARTGGRDAMRGARPIGTR